MTVLLIEELLPGICNFLKNDLSTQRDRLSPNTIAKLDSFLDRIDQFEQEVYISSTINDQQQQQQNMKQSSDVDDLSFLATTPPPPPASFSIQTQSAQIVEQQNSNQIDASAIQFDFSKISTPSSALLRYMSTKSRSLPLSKFNNNNCSTSSSSQYHHPVLPPRWSLGRELDISERDSVYEEPMTNDSSSSSSSNQLPRRARFSAPPEPVPQALDNNNHNPTDITLPRHQTNTSSALLNNGPMGVVVSSRRFSTVATIEQQQQQPFTLIGNLSYRYKTNRWQSLHFSILTSTGRLIAYRTTRSLSPTINLYLLGCRAIYSGKENGQEFVFRVLHPSVDACVLAAPSEEQALGWIEQISLYCVGKTPTFCKSFLDPVIQPQPQQQQQQHSEEIVVVQSPMQSTTTTSSDTPTQRATVPTYASPNQQQRHSHAHNNNNNNNSSDSSSSSSFLQQTAIDSKIYAKVSEFGLNRVSSSVGGSVVVVGGGGGSVGAGGASGLLHSVRKKVESIGSKKRLRKLQNIQFQPSSDCILSGLAKICITKRRIWCERVCQLRPGMLEAYRLLTLAEHYSLNHQQQPSQAPQQQLTLDFALSLNGIELSRCTNKRHESALRLSCKDATDDMLFEIDDKLQMGAWIRAFIQAMGIIPIDKKSNNNNSSSDASWLPVGTPSSAQRLFTPYPPFFYSTGGVGGTSRGVGGGGDDPVYDEVCTPPPPPPVSQSQENYATECGVVKQRKKSMRTAVTAAWRRTLPPLPLPMTHSPSTSFEEVLVEETISPTQCDSLPSAAGAGVVHPPPDPAIPSSPPTAPCRSLSFLTKASSEPHLNHHHHTSSSMSDYEFLTSEREQEREQQQHSNDDEEHLLFNNNNNKSDCVDSGGGGGGGRSKRGGKKVTMTHGCSLADLIARFENIDDECSKSDVEISTTSTTTTTRTSVGAADVVDDSLIYHEYDINAPSSSHTTTRSSNNPPTSSPILSDKTTIITTPPPPLHYHLRTASRFNPSTVKTTAALRKTSLEVEEPKITSLKAEIVHLKTTRSKLYRDLKEGLKNHQDEEIILIDAEISRKETELQVLELQNRRRFTKYS